MLEKAEREKDDLRASNDQHKLCINYLEASFYIFPEKTLVYCSYRAISENQTQGLIF